MKGLFTQGASLLLNGPVALEELEVYLRDVGEVREVPGSADWEIGGPSLLVPFRPEVNGQIAVDVVARPWPDDMGDPERSPTLFAAWSAGHFGPFAYPRSFQRSCQQAWRWPEARERPPRHAGFIRLKTSYSFGHRSEEPVVPPDYDPLAELEHLSRAVMALMGHPDVRCYFNASGEALLPKETFAEALSWAREEELPALDAWTNIRFFKLDGVADGWYLMDTVGMWQLDVPDLEAFVPADRYDFGEVDSFLRNACLYLQEHGEIIKDGDTLEGPGDVLWQARTCETSFTDPPRQVVRWFPQDGCRPPEQLLPPGPN